MKYIKSILIMILMAITYCVFIWHQPNVGVNIDYILRTNFNEQLTKNMTLYGNMALSYGEKIYNWIQNPAPNTSSKIKERYNTNKENAEKKDANIK